MNYLDPIPVTRRRPLDPRAALAHRRRMAAFMRTYQPQAYALLRIVTGFLFMWHGFSKLFGIPMPPPPEAPAFVVWVAGTIELVGGVLVMVGLLTRWAAFLSSGLMAFAYWLGHGMNALLPVSNGGELAALYCFVFLYIAAHGPGIWSLEAGRGD